MKHETTINELARFAGLFSVVDHITVPETDPNTDITEEVTLPPPLIRRTQRRDNTIWWVLTPPGIHERIFVADQATVTVYLKDVDPGRFTGHAPQHQAPAQQPAVAAPAAWQQQPAAPAAYPAQQQAPTAPQPAAPQRPAAPWSNQQPQG
ncbi:hypothetical protein BGM19_01030 [Streptomyces agglomeratus]|uniref:hypothetical protein n=1 Tax=Streptomyces agglomeratus TaxID=285458 RepID=UPI000852879C|nr:hypothetical protein [Streptomyces agglomeratus]OEJ56832.1 hypothetical protein BGM19_01030 [Streptomyces agglomeratus]